jgi:hypothetical protein
MSTLVQLSIVCAVGAIALTVYCAVLLRRRTRAASQEAEPPPQVAAPPPAEVPRVAARLPGMPPQRGMPVPPSWAAVERNLEPRRAARGSVAQMQKLAPNRFDDVLTAGLPVVQPQRRTPMMDDEQTEDPGAPAKH